MRNRRINQSILPRVTTMKVPLTVHVELAPIRERLEESKIKAHIS